MEWIGDEELGRGVSSARVREGIVGRHRWRGGSGSGGGGGGGVGRDGGMEMKTGEVGDDGGVL